MIIMKNLIQRLGIRIVLAAAGIGSLIAGCGPNLYEWTDKNGCFHELKRGSIEYINCNGKQTWRIYASNPDVIAANEKEQKRKQEEEKFKNQYTDEERMAAQKRADEQLKSMVDIYTGALQRAGGDIIGSEYERARQK